MTITYNNYPEQKSKIDFSKLPKTVTDIVPNISALDDYHELYNDDETIAKAFDFVLEKINAANFVKNHIVFAKMPPTMKDPKFKHYDDVKFHVGDMPEKWAYGNIESINKLDNGKYSYRVNGYFEEDGKILKMDAKNTELDEVQLYEYSGDKYDVYKKRYEKEKATVKAEKTEISTTHTYKLGDKYRSDFDDEGMMKMGLQTTVKWGSKKLEKLFESFQDNNYHTVAAPLWGAITLLKKAEKVEDTAKEAAYRYDAEDLLKDFHSLIKDLGITDDEDKPTAKSDTGKPVKFFVKGQWVDFSKVELDWDHPINILDRKSGQFKQALEEYVNEHPELLKSSKQKTSQPKTSKPKREPKVKLEKTKDMRAVIPEDVKLLRRVKNLIGKRKAKKDFINTHKAIELADTERRITKTSQYADELNYSLEWIEKCVNYMVEQGEESGQFKLKDEAMQAAIVEAANGYAIMEAVAILKQYIKLQGRTESRVAAQKLYDRLVKYETNGPKAAHYSSKLSEVKSELQNFLNHKKTSLNLSATALSGITQGLGCNCTLSEIGYVAKPTNTDYDLPIPRKKNDGFSGFGNINPLPGAASDDFNFEAANYVVEDDEDTDPKVDINPYDGGVPMNQVKVNTNTFKLPGDIGKFIGPIALDRYAMILKGDPGAGKSRLSLMIANAFLAKFPRVDYFSFEMSPNNPVIKADYFDKYIQPDRAGRLITHSEGTIEKVRRVAGKSRVVIIDSWGKLGCRIEEYGNLRKTFPGTAFIVIFQSTVDGKARGGSSSAFDCDELVHIHTSEGDYKKTFAQKQKTRYGTPDLQFNLFEQKLM